MVRRQNSDFHGWHRELSGFVYGGIYCLTQQQHANKFKEHSWNCHFQANHLTQSWDISGQRRFERVGYDDYTFVLLEKKTNEAILSKSESFSVQINLEAASPRHKYYGGNQTEILKQLSIANQRRRTVYPISKASIQCVI